MNRYLQGIKKKLSQANSVSKMTFSSNLSGLKEVRSDMLSVIFIPPEEQMMASIMVIFKKKTVQE